MASLREAESWLRSIVADDASPPRAEALFEQIRWRPIFVLAATIGASVLLLRIVAPLWTGAFSAAATLHRARAASEAAHALERRLRFVDAAAINGRLAAIEPRFLVAANLSDAEQRLRTQLSAAFSNIPGVRITVTATGKQAGIATARVAGRAPEAVWAAALVQLRQTFPRARASRLYARRIDAGDKPGMIDMETTLFVLWTAA